MQEPPTSPTSDGPASERPAEDQPATTAACRPTPRGGSRTGGLLTYVVVLLVAKVDWLDVWHGLLGRGIGWQQDYWAIIVAILGTTQSPYVPRAG